MVISLTASWIRWCRYSNGPNHLFQPNEHAQFAFVWKFHIFRKLCQWKFRPHDHSASVRPETRDTLLRDKRLAQYAAKERRENAKDQLGSHVGQLDDGDPAETGVRFSSQAGILRGACHGWVPYCSSHDYMNNNF